jgi:hypothetical protein
MRKRKLSIAIVGAGSGGLAAAVTLRRFGSDVRAYEQASRFKRIGAGIQMMPNSMKVLEKIGIAAHSRNVSFAPRSHLNRAPLGTRQPNISADHQGRWKYSAIGDATFVKGRVGADDNIADNRVNSVRTDASLPETAQTAGLGSAAKYPPRHVELGSHSSNGGAVTLQSVPRQPAHMLVRSSQRRASMSRSQMRK